MESGGKINCGSFGSVRGSDRLLVGLAQLRQRSDFLGYGRENKGRIEIETNIVHTPAGDRNQACGDKILLARRGRPNQHPGIGYRSVAAGDAAIGGAVYDTRILVARHITLSLIDLHR